MIEKLLANASSNGATLLEGYSCEHLLAEEGSVFGIIAQDHNDSYQLILPPVGSCGLGRNRESIS